MPTSLHVGIAPCREVQKLNTSVRESGRVNGPLHFSVSYAQQTAAAQLEVECFVCIRISSRYGVVFTLMRSKTAATYRLMIFTDQVFSAMDVRNFIFDRQECCQWVGSLTYHPVQATVSLKLATSRPVDLEDIKTLMSWKCSFV